MARRSAEPGSNGKNHPTRRSDRFLAGLANAGTVILVSHVHPDPDSLGSMLGLAHLIDTSDMAEMDPVKAFEIIEGELGAFSETMLDKPMIVVATKLDATTDHSKLEELRAFCSKKGLQFHVVSAPTGDGVKELVRTGVVATYVGASVRDLGRPGYIAGAAPQADRQSDGHAAAAHRRRGG